VGWRRTRERDRDRAEAPRPGGRGDRRPGRGLRGRGRVDGRPPPGRDRAGEHDRRRHSRPAPRQPHTAAAIAVKRPGTLPLPLLERWLDGIVTVDDEAIVGAMVRLAERTKLVTE